MNLSHHNLAELRDRVEQVRREISKHAAQDMIRAREAILFIAHNLGVFLKDILDARGKIEPAKGTSLYQHPDDALPDWSDRGRQPGWVSQWLVSGQPPEALRA